MLTKVCSVLESNPPAAKMCTCISSGVLYPSPTNFFSSRRIVNMSYATSSYLQQVKDPRKRQKRRNSESYMVPPFSSIIFDPCPVKLEGSSLVGVLYSLEGLCEVVGKLSVRCCSSIDPFARISYLRRRIIVCDLDSGHLEATCS
jgi:hypothetical protein